MPQLFTSCDLKQAEAMVVAYDAQDIIRIKAFEEDKDIHRVNGCLLFRGWGDYNVLPPDEMLASITTVCDACAGTTSKCIHSERHRAKVAGHASAYKMGARKFCAEQRKVGLFIPESEAKKYLGLLVSPAIRDWQARVEQQLRRSRWLTAPLGAKREFYGLLDDDMVREALSWIAQVTVAQVTTIAMLRLYKTIKTKKLPCRIVTQTHDSLLISHDATLDLRQILTKAFDIPILVHDRILRIPIDIESGPSWGELS